MVSNDPSSPWIISRRDDLLWFQGSVIAGIILLAFFAAAPFPDSAQLSPSDPVILVVFLWGVLFDGTHVWATYARSYLAPDTNSRAGIPKPRWWLIFALGPALAVADAALQLRGALFSYFLLAAYLWAYWHLVRQHYGFLVLYRRRAGENNRRGQLLDSFILWVGCLYPFLRFSLSEAYLHSGLPQLVPVALLPQLAFILDVAFCLLMGAAVLLAVTGRYGQFRPGPKHLLLTIVIVFHVLVFALLSHLLTILATLTIFHNLQYHRIVWQYEAGRGRRPLGGLVPYLAGGLLLGLVWYGLRVPAAVALTNETARNVVLGLCWGVAFHHYLVDARIWRVRRTPALAQALNVGAVGR
ncbi:MAG TPA: hypothetical protein VEG37_07375 [Burkholderiales bacterium]|nr:hypothetical protein [Burkholderiales bacterium]